MSSKTGDYISSNIKIIKQFFDNLSEWNDISPLAQQALEELEILEQPEKDAPREAKQGVNENLLSHL